MIVIFTHLCLRVSEEVSLGGDAEVGRDEGAAGPEFLGARGHDGVPVLGSLG